MNDDSYQKARPLSLRPSLACMYTLTHSLLCLTADMSAVSHSRHVCCLMWTLGLLWIAHDGSTWVTLGGRLDFVQP